MGMYCIIVLSASFKERNWVKLSYVLWMVKMFQIKQYPAQTFVQLSNQTSTHTF